MSDGDMVPNRAEVKAQGWDWLARECERVLAEIRAARGQSEEVVSR